MPHFFHFLHRHISSASSISYSGYLLKRSNQPYQKPAQPTTIPIDPMDVPELPVMPGIFAPINLEDQWGAAASSVFASAAVPLHSTSPQLPAPIEEPRAEDESPKNPIQIGLESAAAFFGISLNDEKDTTQQQTVPPVQNKPPPTLDTNLLPPPTVLQPKKKASTPIKVGGGSSLNNRVYKQKDSRESFQESFHRRHSSPILCTPNSDSDVESFPSQPRSNSPPDDFIDLKDGHLWRAKYCVLEEGVLYFYRNTTDGESVEAIRERRQASSSIDESQNSETHTEKDLSKSPMARNYFHHLDSNESGESGGMWEKRVFLNAVGGVRSAEQEYCMNSFELLGINDDDGDLDYVDTLVLQARDQSDMNEWMFQFHRSLTSFMRNIMDVVGSSSTAGFFLDIDHPVLSLPRSRMPPKSSSEKQLQKLLAMAPKITQTPPPPISLSHGHGRITVHRRRPDVRNKVSTTVSENGTSSLSSTPETGGSGSSQLQFAMREPSPINFLGMIPAASAEDGFLIPPMKKPAQQEPELSGPQSDYPETERPKPAAKGKYVSPSLRNKQQQSDDGAAKKKYVPPHLRAGGSKRYVPPHLRNGDGGQPGKEPSVLSLEERAKNAPLKEKAPTDNTSESTETSSSDNLDIVGEHTMPFKRGGCADPQVVKGSILDPVFIPKKASRVGPVATDAFGCYGGGELEGSIGVKSSLRWETGAVSECGIRDSNEDAYLIANDLLDAFRSFPQESLGSKSSWTQDEADHLLGLFAMFDGHCGNEAARFAAEKLAYFIYDELIAEPQADDSEGKSFGNGGNGLSPFHPLNVEEVLREASIKLDDEFCRLCQEEGREWESGATALVAVIVNEHLVIANLGDCRGVLCRFVEDKDSYTADDCWNELDTVIDDFGRRSKVFENDDSQRCFWKEVTNIHCPSEEIERKRIEKANGWITTETEIPIGQLRRMDFLDEEVIGILKRCFSDRCENSERTATKECKAVPQRILHISRVCGELAVSRALGDRDFKAAFNTTSPTGPIDMDDDQWWDCPLFLPYPDLHTRQFQGDLVSNSPDFQRIRVGEEGVSDEFLVLACDGLWDVMDSDDAVRVTQDLLFRKKWTAKRAVRLVFWYNIFFSSNSVSSHCELLLFSRLHGLLNWRFI
jgi:serine/threonine protein phosphatase PrpC